MADDPFEPVNVQGVKFPGIGCCIYCGSDGEGKGLRSEHIVPYSLGGTTEILEASCHRCEGVTSYLDGYLANVVFRQFRIAARLQSRSKTTTKTKTMPVTYKLKDGEETTVDLPVEDCPHCVALPQLLPPGVMRQQPPQTDFNHFGMRTYMNIPDSFIPAIGYTGADPVAVKYEGAVKLHPFGRALAKIAYCHVLVQQRIAAFELTDVTDLILGKYPYTSFLVGGFAEEPRPAEPGAWHTISSRPVIAGDRIFLMCQLRLFSHISDGAKNHGLPRYQVAIGDVTDVPNLRDVVHLEET